MRVLDQNPSEVAGGAAALDPHEGISASGTETRCERWPERLRLQSSDGQLVRGRCRSVNLCDYCAQLASIENTALLTIDATVGTSPTVLAILTTRTATADPKPFYRARSELYRALKARYGPQVAYAALVEFTTGYGPASGGKRRPHWNLLLKGLPVDQIDDVREVIVSTWCRHVDALPQGQYVEALNDAAAAVRYVGNHFQKASQHPPKGWKGHRFTRSRNYLWTDTATARSEAKEKVQTERELWKAEQHYEAAGITPQDRYDLGIDVAGEAREAVKYAAALTWEVTKLGITDDGQRFALSSGQLVDDFDPDRLNPTTGRRSPRASATVDVSGAEGLHGKTARPCADGRTDADAAEPPHRRAAPARPPALPGRPAACVPPPPSPVNALGDPAQAREPTERPSDASHA